MQTNSCLAILLDTPRFDQAVRAFAGVLLFGLFVLLVLILGYQVVVDARQRKRNLLRQRVRESVGKVLASRNPDMVYQITIPDYQSLFDRRGLGVLLRVFEEMNEESRDVLRKMLMRIGYGNYVHKQLSSEDEDFLTQLVRMVAELHLQDLSGKVSDLLYQYPHNTDLQYHCFLALSRLGATEEMAAVFMDLDFSHALSFRSLEQIMVAFQGSKKDLYAHLLYAPDPYVVRICIKRIGAERYEDLAPECMRWLNNPVMNLQMDAIRTLGQLRYRPAAGQIAAALQSPHWEVRGVAVTALAAIDLADCEDLMIAALQDSEWQVRYNAGTALRGCASLEELVHKVQATQDKFALEMLEYMMQTAEIWGTAS